MTTGGRGTFSSSRVVYIQGVTHLTDIIDIGPKISQSSGPGLDFSEVVAPQTADLVAEIGELKREIRTLTDALQAHTEALVGSEEAAEPREVSDETARMDVADLLKSGGEHYPSDISKQLGLPYDQVWKVLRQLEQEGSVDSGLSEGD